MSRPDALREIALHLEIAAEHLESAAEIVSNELGLERIFADVAREAHLHREVARDLRSVAARAEAITR